MKIDMTADLSQYTNSTGYEIYHDDQTALYEIKSKGGYKLPGRYTTRAFARNALIEYLDTARKQTGPGRAKKDLTVKATKTMVSAMNREREKRLNVN